MYKILVVEDDPKIAGMLCAAISKYDYEVRVVDDFNNVLESLKAS